MEFKDYYQTLGVARDAKPDEIKRAYRRRARKYHPDVSSEANAEDRFKEVQEAYEVLKDPEKRSAYDRFGENWKAGQDFQPPPGWNAASQGHFRGDGFAGAAEFGEFSDFFESLFGGRPSGSRAGDRSGRRGFGGFSVRGEDLHAKVRITLEDAFRGAIRPISLEVPESDDQGNVRRKVRTLNVKIPRGIGDGQRIRLAGQGAPGMGSAPSGDLYLEVELAPHRLFRAVGKDIHLELPVAPWEAVLGRTVTVPTLGGDVELKVPPGARSGQRLRLKGRGLPGSPAGDQYVELEIVLPEARTEKDREFFEKMEREFAFDPRAHLGA